MGLPKISVITASYNQGEFIRQNIESVLAQNYPDFEHIVIDGGSSDETVEILRSYPHLTWTSEPDRGQSDALNKGFARAGGEIIAWLNSDDWYPSGVFHEVAEALQTRPLAIGRCELTDRYGKTYDWVKNAPPTWFDILKYWVYYSIPAQPAIFFRREVLEAVRRDDGKFLDEDLEFGMDYEFWLRVARKFVFDCHIDRTLAYARMYDENKTGKNMSAATNEYQRIFKRHANLAGGTEHAICFVVPVNIGLQGLKESLAQIGRQSLADYQVLLVDYSGDRQFFRALQKEVINFCGHFTQSLRLIQAEAPNYAAALHSGVLHAGAPLVAFLQPGAVVGDSFALNAVRAMSDNAVALQVPLRNRSDLVDAFTVEHEGSRIFNQLVLLGEADLPLNLLVRKVALMELGGFQTRSDARYALREMALRLLFKGWQIWVDFSMEVDAPAAAEGAIYGRPPCAQEFLRLRAMLVDGLRREYRCDAMAALRAKHGFCPKMDWDNPDGR